MRRLVVLRHRKFERTSALYAFVKRTSRKAMYRMYMMRILHVYTYNVVSDALSPFSLSLWLTQKTQREGGDRLFDRGTRQQ